MLNLVIMLRMSNGWEPIMARMLFASMTAGVPTEGPPGLLTTGLEASIFGGLTICDAICFLIALGAVEIPDPTTGLRIGVIAVAFTVGVFFPGIMVDVTN